MGHRAGAAHQSCAAASRPAEFVEVVRLGDRVHLAPVHEREGSKRGSGGGGSERARATRTCGPVRASLSRRQAANLDVK
eukprot:6592237-Prymnesium_polylepis.1